MVLVRPDASREAALPLLSIQISLGRLNNAVSCFRQSGDDADGEQDVGVAGSVLVIVSAIIRSTGVRSRSDMVLLSHRRTLSILWGIYRMCRPRVVTQFSHRGGTRDPSVNDPVSGVKPLMPQFWNIGG